MGCLLCYNAIILSTPYFVSGSLQNSLTDPILEGQLSLLVLIIKAT